ncbi:hypothetical protein BV898_15659 [Hypsibius exemplaris]|uniref:G-protein coupled receptors family 1 profile domain-containing protein n=1 Tax=Hypsibius exemplaris TaxID=2072580 RepID=A0A9X6NBJ0_HYPEX|nr:hypothetical protein BV898_15659 [Hypsibius exemplaris]
MGNHAFSFYLYYLSVFDAGIINSHAVIAVNRAWVIIRPMSLRAVHSKRFTLIVCMVMLLYKHLVAGSFWLADTLYFRMDAPIKVCLLNTVQLNVWSSATDIIVYILSLAVTLLSFFVVVVSKMHRSRQTMKRSGCLKSQNSTARTGDEQPAPISRTSMKRSETVTSAAVAVQAVTDPILFVLTMDKLA